MLSFNEKLAEKIAFAPRVFFFFDYDGTLTPIVCKPERAVLKPSTRSVLRRLSHSRGVKIAVISGRSLKDLQSMLGPVPEIICVGNHGLEIKGAGMEWNHPSVAQTSKIMARIWEGLTRNLTRVKGMLLENKTLGISLHYRLVPEEKVAGLYQDFQKIVAPWIRRGAVSVLEGKKVWEIRPRKRFWDKGKAVRWLLQKNKNEGAFLPVFFGDDRTDEDAFKVLGSSGVTIKVTENPRAFSAAKYYIHSPAEVVEFLEQALRARRAHFRRTRA